MTLLFPACYLLRWSFKVTKMLCYSLTFVNFRSVALSASESKPQHWQLEASVTRTFHTQTQNTSRDIELTSQHIENREQLHQKNADKTSTSSPTARPR
jgi:hypothetical protein